MGLPILDTEKDEFEKYARNDHIPIMDLKTFNPIFWWNDCKAVFHWLHLYAFDTLSIPVMSAEYERVFRS